MIRLDAPSRVPMLAETLGAPVLEGDTVRIAGYPPVLDLDRFDVILGWELFPARLHRFEGRLVLLAPVVQMRP